MLDKDRHTLVDFCNFVCIDLILEYSKLNTDIFRSSYNKKLHIRKYLIDVFILWAIRKY